MPLIKALFESEAPGTNHKNIPNFCVTTDMTVGGERLALHAYMLKEILSQNFVFIDL